MAYILQILLMNYKLLSDSNVCLPRSHKKAITQYSASFCCLCVLFGGGCAFEFCGDFWLGWTFFVCLKAWNIVLKFRCCLSYHVVLNSASPMSCSEAGAEGTIFFAFFAKER